MLLHPLITDKSESVSRDNYSVPQFDGNDSFLSQSTLSSENSDSMSCDMSLDSSVITESQCSCCDGMSEYGTSSAYESDCDDIGHTIPVVGTWIKSNVICEHPPVWYEEYIPWTADPRQSKLNRKTIKSDNRHVIGEPLPVIAVSNLGHWPQN